MWEAAAVFLLVRTKTTSVDEGSAKETPERVLGGPPFAEDVATMDVASTDELLASTEDPILVSNTPVCVGEDNRTGTPAEAAAVPPPATSADS